MACVVPLHCSTGSDHRNSLSKHSSTEIAPSCGVKDVVRKILTNTGIQRSDRRSSRIFLFCSIPDACGREVSGVGAPRLAGPRRGGVCPGLSRRPATERISELIGFLLSISGHYNHRPCNLVTVSVNSTFSFHSPYLLPYFLE